MDNNLKALVNGTKLNDYQKALAYLEYTKLKQEHAEMVEILELFIRENYLSHRGDEIAEQLLNKIKENEN